MHDKHGRLIEVGDVVAAKSWSDENIRAKRVHKTHPGSDTCNIVLEDFDPREQRQTFNAKDSVLLLKADGTILENEPENQRQSSLTNKETAEC